MVGDSPLVTARGDNSDQLKWDSKILVFVLTWEDINPSVGQ